MKARNSNNCPTAAGSRITVYGPVSSEIGSSERSALSTARLATCSGIYHLGIMCICNRPACIALFAVGGQRQFRTRTRPELLHTERIHYRHGVGRYPIRACRLKTALAAQLDNLTDCIRPQLWRVLTRFAVIAVIVGAACGEGNDSKSGSSGISSAIVQASTTACFKASALRSPVEVTPIFLFLIARTYTVVSARYMFW